MSSPFERRTPPPVAGVSAEPGAGARGRGPGTTVGAPKRSAHALTFFSFPKTQWKALRTTTNVIDRLNKEFRPRVKNQCSFPDEESATALLFALVASGRIKLRRLDGWRVLADVVSLNHHLRQTQTQRKAAA